MVLFNSDLAPPDVFLDEWIDKMGLPTSLGASNTEKECSTESATARGAYQRCRKERERRHAVYGHNTRALPNNVKYEVRLHNNRKSAHAVKVNDRMYQYMMNKELKSMEHRICSRNNEQGTVMSGNSNDMPALNRATNGPLRVYRTSAHKQLPDEENIWNGKVSWRGVKRDTFMKMEYFIKFIKAGKGGTKYMRRSVVGQTTLETTHQMENCNDMYSPNSLSGDSETCRTSDCLGSPALSPVSQTSVKSPGSGNLSRGDVLQKWLNPSPYQHWLVSHASAVDDVEPSFSIDDGNTATFHPGREHMDEAYDLDHPFSLEPQDDPLH